jgi:hypothetical protein
MPSRTLYLTGLQVQELSVVAYTSRSLERRTDVAVPFPSTIGNTRPAASCYTSMALPRNSSCNRLVEDVMQEFESGDLEAYLPHVNTGINSLHYTSPIDLDYTLVAFLPSHRAAEK